MYEKESRERVVTRLCIMNVPALNGVSAEIYFNVVVAELFPGGTVWRPELKNELRRDDPGDQDDSNEDGDHAQKDS